MIGPVTEYGLRGQVIADSAQSYRRVATLTEQSASGLIADNYAGLGAGARVAIDLSPEIARQTSVAQQIGVASGRAGVAQTALKQITQIAQDLYGSLPDLNNLGPSPVDSLAAKARDALRQVAGLLDTTDGNTYVFAGQDSANAPVPQPDQILSSGFYTQINAAVSGLAASGAAATAAATLSVAGSNTAGTTPFSAYLSAAAAAGTDVRPTVQTGLGGGAAGAAGARVPISVTANANGDVVSGGTSTTGSYIRDILRALATVGSLSSSQTGAAGFGALVEDTRASLDGAITAIGEDSGVLGDRQTALSGIADTATATATALTSQVSDVQDADLARVSTELSQAQTQLQVSYKLLSGLNSLSLVQFL